MRAEVPNARFWEWVNGGWVKLTIRPDQGLQRYTFQRTDEGWSAEWEAWEHDGAGVHARYMTEGVDCDGRSEYHADSYCPLGQLAAVESYHDWDEVGPRHAVPAWERGVVGQRDYTAEVAGY